MSIESFQIAFVVVTLGDSQQEVNVGLTVAFLDRCSLTIQGLCRCDEDPSGSKIRNMTS